VRGVPPQKSTGIGSIQARLKAQRILKLEGPVADAIGPLALFGLSFCRLTVRRLVLDHPGRSLTPARSSAAATLCLIGGWAGSRVPCWPSVFFSPVWQNRVGLRRSVEALSRGNNYTSSRSATDSSLSEVLPTHLTKTWFGLSCTTPSTIPQ